MKKSFSNKVRINSSFNPKPYVTPGITERDVIEAKEAFDLLDQQGNGKIQPKQLDGLFNLYNVNKDKKAFQMAVQFLVKPRKTIDFPTFLTVMTAFTSIPLTKPNLKKIFQLFDDERTGGISAVNLKRLIKQLRLSISQQEIELMVERADLNNDGLVAEDEFAKILAKVAGKV